LHIPLPWDDVLLGHKDSYSSRDLQNLDDYASQVGIPRNKILLSNLFWLMVMLIVSWLLVGIVTLIAPKVGKENIRKFLLYKRLQMLAAPVIISYFGLTMAVGIQLSLTETLHGAGWIVLYIISLILIVSRLFYIL
jgi:hypothetical protein